MTAQPYSWGTGAGQALCCQDLPHSCVPALQGTGSAPAQESLPAQPPHPAPRYNHSPAEKDWPPWARENPVSERPRPWAGQGRREAGGREEQGHIHRWAAEMLPHKWLKRADGVRKLQQRPGQGSRTTRDIGFSGQASLRRTNRRVTWTNSCHATRQGGGQSPMGWTWGRRKCGHVSGILSPGPKTAGGGQTTRRVRLHSPRRKEWPRDHTPPPHASSRAPSPLLTLWLLQGTGAHPMPNAAAEAKPRGAGATLQHPGHHRQSTGTGVLGGPGCNPRGRRRIKECSGPNLKD